MAMKPEHRTPRGLLLLVAVCFAAPTAAYESGSTGADGAFNPAVNTVVQLPPSGIFNFTTINIPAGVTVRFARNARNTPVVLLATGNVTIAGTIDVSGENGRNVGQYGDGNRADDGLPGVGGPGGFDGGRGGSPDAQQTPSVVDGAAGQGPGGGEGGRVGTLSYSNCRDNRANWLIHQGLGASFVPGFGGRDRAAAGYWAYGCNQGTPTTSPQAPPYGNRELVPLIGGSGGGGGRGSTTHAGAGGGGGGGALLIASSTLITITGSIRADGGNAGIPQGYSGGGGAGGAIRLIASEVTGNGTLRALEGCDLNTSGNRSCSGDTDWASTGRVRIEAERITFSGTSTEPPFTSGLPAATVGTLASLRVTAVAGTAISDNPSGVDDVVLPANVQNPVVVSLASVNLPLSATVRVRVVPTVGLPIVVDAGALTGSLQAATTSAQVSMPQGPSRLEAYATFQLSAPAAAALAPLADNEAVAAIELWAAGSSSATDVTLITQSGRRFVVPKAVLAGVPLGG